MGLIWFFANKEYFKPRCKISKWFTFQQTTNQMFDIAPNFNFKAFADNNLFLILLCMSFFSFWNLYETQTYRYMLHKYKSTSLQKKWFERIVLNFWFCSFCTLGFFWSTSLNLHCKSWGPWNNGTVPGTASSSWESSIYSNFHSVRSKKKLPDSPHHTVFIIPQIHARWFSFFGFLFIPELC